MNLSDFVNGVDISLDDFEETGRIGYVEGLSRIFCKELRKLDISERPIHCSDAKREIIFPALLSMSCFAFFVIFLFP